ncbi:hypothetical protein K0B04_04140 [Patescibacteria group bacterium]|nr:hypothetical protein [Patescibacteria group bacterium]
MSKIIGALFVGYLSFIFSTVKILPLNSIYLWFLPVIWGFVNLYIYLRYKPIKEFPLKQVLISEIIFITLYGFWTFIKAHTPEIYGIERFMDFGFIQLLGNSRFSPLEDIWMSGLHLNYYYFGHFVSYLLIFFSRVPSEVGFFLVGAALFGLIGSCVFRLAFDIFNYISRDSKTYLSYLAGFLSLYFVLFSGIFQTPFDLISGKDFFYADAARAIPGTITEPPLYSFMEADLHAHVWGLVIGTVVMFSIFNTWSNQETREPTVLFLGYAIGLAVMTNTWDSVTLGFLTGVVLMFLIFKDNLSFSRFILYFSIIIMVSFLISYPWLFFFESPTASISFVKIRSDLWQWFSFWGHFVLIYIIYFTIFIKNIRLVLKKELILVAIVLAAFILIGLTELIYVKDILDGGEWTRANTVFKVTSQTWLWLGFSSGPAIILSICGVKNNIGKIVTAIILLMFFLLTIFYPIKAINQVYLKGRELANLNSGLNWIQERYPDDYRAYEFLRNIRDDLPIDHKKKVILEAEGESYNDTSIFSTFLGWPTVAGWNIHEWTWRGDYNLIGTRGMEVREIYMGDSLEVTKALVKKYNIEFIVVGSVERNRYDQYLNEYKISKIAEEVFRSEGTSIYYIK